MFEIIGSIHIGLSLKDVAFFVFELNCPVSLVFDELTDNFRAINHDQLSSLATTLVLEPFTIKVVAIGVVHDALAFSDIIFHVAFIELTIAEEDLHVAVLEVPAIKACFKDLIGCAE